MKPLDLTEEEIAVASVEELRDAYRELVAENQALRALIGEKTRGAIETLRGQGFRFNGNLPYGMDADEVTKKLKSSRHEQRLIRETKQLHAEGHTLRAIARTLTERHFVNRKGHPIDAKLVSRILVAAGVISPKGKVG